MVVPHLVHLVLDFFIMELSSRPWHVAAERRSRHPGGGATDASGKRGGGRCGIGGWFCQGEVEKASAAWFMYEFSPSSLPWAFDRDEDSSRRISALELLGTAVYVKMVIRLLSRCHCDGSQPVSLGLIIPGCTDNQGNSHILAKLYSRRWPASAVLMEVAHDLQVHDVSVEVKFMPRELNTWADALANGDSSGFSAENRFSPDLADPSFWQVLPRLLSLGTEMGYIASAEEKGQMSVATVSSFSNRSEVGQAPTFQ